MDTVIVKGGKFTFTLSNSEMSRGLRPSEMSIRNSEYLTECIGAVGQEGTLSTLNVINEFATSVVTDGFPFPQLFIFPNVMIVCGLKKVYEFAVGSLALKYTATTPGGLWQAVAFGDYVYMSNGVEAVVRDAGSKTYAKTTVLPTAQSICNFNGQVLIGAPDVSGLGASLLIGVNSLALTMSISGSWA